MVFGGGISSFMRGVCMGGIFILIIFLGRGGNSIPLCLGTVIALVFG